MNERAGGVLVMVKELLDVIFRGQENSREDFFS
jgi:hypothetical protein